jgi:hypothetical protein
LQDPLVGPDVHVLSRRVRTPGALQALALDRGVDSATSGSPVSRRGGMATVWAVRFAATPYGSGLAFCDPDGIALEFFAPPAGA